MRILSVAYPLFPINADSAGGAEQILFLLEQEIVIAGHESVVVAAEGSTVAGQLVATPAFALTDCDEDRRPAQENHRSIIERLLRERCFDAVHYHGLDAPAYYCERAGANVVTSHLPTSWYEPSIFSLPGATVVYVSHSQAVGLEGPVIPNGIDVERFLGAGAPREYLLCMARICPEKGVYFALQAAHRLGERMVIAGPVHPFRVHEEYFAKEVVPLLDDKRTYVGPVGVADKIRLLAGAKALLIPSLAAETSSLVAMEAAAAGTPVVAFGSGALPEVVEDGVTGYLVDDVSGMVRSIARCGEIDADRCRATARARFDKRTMAAGYLALYKRLLSGKTSD